MIDAVAPELVRRILIIKLSALGDIVQAVGPMAAIRQHHPEARITVLTTKPYDALLDLCPYIDDVWLDERPKWYQVLKCRALRDRVRSGRFDMVYDLQTSGRSSAYFRLFPASQRPFWSGIARGASHPHANPGRNQLHTIERQAEQLCDAGIPETPFPNLHWVTADTAHLDLSPPFALLVPGGAPHRPGKRWPATSYTALAKHLVTRGIQPVLLGTTAEHEILRLIADSCSDTINLCGLTSIPELAVLARDAVAAVGNDTGPMHIITLSGCASVVLYSDESDPALCAQRGPSVEILRRERLSDLPLEDVITTLNTVAENLPDESTTQS